MTAPISNHDSLIAQKHLHWRCCLTDMRAHHRASGESPVRSLRGPVGPPYAGFCERLMYQNLDSNLRTGQMSTVLNGKIISEDEARRMVAYARAQGWLPPEAPW